ncbi:MAG TPA: hypothetical protein VGA51_04535 [Casimicrobiaceae bacterium]
MNVRLPTLVAAALLVVIGCATYAARTADDYDQGQAPRPQFVKDNEACARQAEVDQRKFGIGGEMDPTHATFNRMYDACMRASGYQRRQKDAK